MTSGVESLYAERVRRKCGDANASPPWCNSSSASSHSCTSVDCLRRAGRRLPCDSSRCSTSMCRSRRGCTTTLVPVSNSSCQMSALVGTQIAPPLVPHRLTSLPRRHERYFKVAWRRKKTPTAHDGTLLLRIRNERPLASIDVVLCSRSLMELSKNYPGLEAEAVLHGSVRVRPRSIQGCPDISWNGPGGRVLA